MKHRRWVIVLAIIVIAVLPASYVGLRIAARRPAVKLALLSRVMPFVGGEVTVGELNLGLASLTVNDVRIVSEDGSSVFVPYASASVSYARLIGSGFDPRRSLDIVIVNTPVIVVRVGMGDTLGSPSADVSRFGRYARMLPSYLVVSDATVIFEDAQTGNALEVSGLDLLMERTDGGDFSGGVTAGCLGAPDNITADVIWNLDSSLLELSIELTEAELRPGLPLIDALPFAPVDGRLEAGAVLTVGAETGVDLKYNLSLSDTDFELDAVPGMLTVDECSCSYESGRLDISTLLASFRGDAVSASGRLNLEHGVFEDLTILTESLDVSGLVPPRDGGISVAGRADARVNVTGPFTDPTLLFDVSFPDLTVEAVTAHDLVTSGEFGSGSLKISRLTAAVFGGDLALSGRADGLGARESLDLSITGDLSEADLGQLLLGRGPDYGAGRISLGDFELSGNAESIDLESLVRWSDAILGPVALGSGVGGVLLKDDVLYVTLDSPDMGYSLSGEVSDVLAARHLDLELQLSSLRVDSLLYGEVGALMSVSLDGPLRISGDLESAAVDGIVSVTGENGAANVRVTGRIRGDTERRVLELSLESDDAVLRGVDMALRGDAVIGENEIAISRLDLGDYGEAEGSVSLKSDGLMRGSLVVSEAPLRDVYTLAIGHEPPDELDGLVFAAISGNGEIGNPSATVQIQVANATIGQVEDLDVAVMATFSDGAINVKELTVQESGRTILLTEGTVVPGGELALSVRGDGIPGPFLAGGIDTRFDLAAGVGGTTGEPNLDALVESSDGEFLGVPFDEFVARVSGAAGQIHVDRLALERDRSYRVTVSGSAPLAAIFDPTSGEEGEVTIEVDGDPLALLGEISSSADISGGTGRMTLRLAGNRSGFTVARAELDATASSIRPTEVFGELRDVHARASVTDGRLRSGAIEAFSGGRSLKLESRRDRTVDGRMLPPLVIGGVDVGVLALTTDAAGVEVSISGLMESGTVGKAAARGRGDAAEFLIAGPSEHPLLWGELTFSDMSFTYPFGDGSEGERDDFLSRASWDLRMSAGRNLWYRRTNISMKLDRGSGLEFVGVPGDHTMCVSGRPSASRGTLEYLHADFTIRTAFIDFPAFCELPRFYVEATTHVADGTEITLTVESDEVAGQFFAALGTALDESTIRLASDDPDDITQEDVLSRLTYGVAYDTLEDQEGQVLERRRALGVVATQVGGMVVRPLVAPVEGRIKRALHLDLVRIDVDFVQYFLAQLDQWRAQEDAGEYQPFFSDSRLTLGKYASQNWLVSYTGEAESYDVGVGERRLGVQHEVGIEYEVSRNTSLSLSVVIDPLLTGWDRRISIENRFEF
ncbi:hypothetical protein KAW64_10375 [bacterium]|nr:hypothetical protein [bacterium]